MSNENEGLSFKCGNPGAVQFGNFINYYQFHPPSDRLAIMPTDIWKAHFRMDETILLLDVGCNTGDLTCALYDFFVNSLKATDCHIIGVDLDPTLIERAREKNCSKNISFECFNIMSVCNQTSNNVLSDFLKRNGRDKFDIMFCFSVTMWIHLNHGDNGLKDFLNIIAHLGEFLVMEPQPWKCYKSAVKRLKGGNSEFPLFKELTVRENVEDEIENFIVHKCGLTKIKESDRTKWGRKVFFFKRLSN